MSTKKTGSKALGRCLLLLLFVMPLLLTCPVNAEQTAYQKISVTSYGNYTNVPITITTTYRIQLIDPATGAVITLYPNRVISLPDGNTAVTGYTSISALDNTFTFILVANLTEGTTYNYSIIFDSTLMQNSTPTHTTFGYMKPHTINPSSGAGTGYQVRINVHNNSGTDSGENVYLNGKCRSDFADVRFYDNDTVTQLPYWIEEKVDGNYAVFWVKVNDDLSSNPATIYIYYGDPGLSTTTSNGTATFNLFDDFNRGNNTIIGNEWTEDEASGSSLSIVSNIVKISSYENYYCHIEKTFPSISNFAIVAKMKCESYPGSSWRPSIVAYWTPYNYAQAGISLSVEPYVTYDINGTTSNLAPFQASANTWYYMMITANESEVKFWRSTDINSWTLAYTLTRPSQWANAPSLIIVGKGYAENSSSYPNSDWDNIHSPYGKTGINYFDNVYVRKYVSPEPSHGTWGSEFSTVSYSIIYGQVITESELTVRIPRMVFQEISVNASSNWSAPENANDVMKLIAESEWGRYALVVLPVFVMLVAGSRHTAGVAGGVATGLCMGVNYMVGAELYSTLILSWIGAVCLLLIIYEARGS